MIKPLQDDQKRLGFPTGEGYVFADQRELMFCKADGNYSQLHLSSGSKYVTSKSLGSLAPLLSTDLFVRVHRTYIVNIDHVVSFDGDTNEVEMTNGTAIPVSRRNKKELISRFHVL